MYFGGDGSLLLIRTVAFVQRDEMLVKKPFPMKLVISGIVRITIQSKRLELCAGGYIGAWFCQKKKIDQRRRKKLKSMRTQKAKLTSHPSERFQMIVALVVYDQVKLTIRYVKDSIQFHWLELYSVLPCIFLLLSILLREDIIFQFAQYSIFRMCYL